MSRKHDLTYSSHLHLERLLAAQEPVSEASDEMLFVIQHQTSELWMRLIIFELQAARERLERRDFRHAMKALRRVSIIFEQLVGSWDVLRTLTPKDFLAFRGSLGTASGFQSYQYRLIEFLLGNRVVAMLEPHRGTPEVLALLREELDRPSLYQVVLACLAERLDSDFGEEAMRVDRPHGADPEVERAWARVYGDPDAYPELYDLGEALVEIEDRFRCWRFNHVTTVQRVIGSKPGTGGTSGVGYLRKVLDVEIFPELWHLRSTL